MLGVWPTHPPWLSMAWNFGRSMDKTRTSIGMEAVWTKPRLPVQWKKYGQTIHISFADYASGMMLKRPTNSCGFPSAVNLMAASPDFSVASVVGKQILLFLSIFKTILLFVFVFNFQNMAFWFVLQCLNHAVKLSETSHNVVQWVVKKDGRGGGGGGGRREEKRERSRDRPGEKDRLTDWLIELYLTKIKV